MAKENFTLLRDLVMILPIQAKRSDYGLVVVGGDPTAPQEGVVVSTGPGLVGEKGKMTIPPVSKGDRVVYLKSTKQDLKHAGDTFHIVPSTDILCKLTVDERSQ